MSEFACNPGTQKHDLFFLLLLISTLLFLKGEVIVRLFKGTFSYRTCYRLRSYCRSLLLIIVKLIRADINSLLIVAIFISGYIKKEFE